MSSLPGIDDRLIQPTIWSENTGKGPTAAGSAYSLATTIIEKLKGLGDHIKGRDHIRGSLTENTHLMDAFAKFDLTDADFVYNFFDRPITELTSVGELMTRLVDLEVTPEKRFVAIPLMLGSSKNEKANHIVGILVDKAENKVIYYDPKGRASCLFTMGDGATLYDCMTGLGSIFLNPASSVVENSITQQYDSNNCGRFTYLFFDYMINQKGSFEDFIQKEIPLDLLNKVGALVAIIARANAG